jgi:hypothetical protein
VYSLGHCAADAAKLIDTFADALRLKWRLSIKASSYKFTSILDDDTPLHGHWNRQKVAECLGQWLDPSSSCASAWKGCKRSMWSSFFAKLPPTRAHALTSQQMYGMMDRYVLPILLAKAPSWPAHSELCKKIGAVQNRMFSALQRVDRIPCEPDNTYFRRRANIAAHQCTEHGKWSWAALKRTINWNGHVMRQDPQLSWGRALLGYHATEWLQQQRQLFAPSSSNAARPWTLFGGRTDTRVRPGKPPTRWTEGVEFASTFADALAEQHRKKLARRKHKRKD